MYTDRRKHYGDKFRRETLNLIKTGWMSHSPTRSHSSMSPSSSESFDFFKNTQNKQTCYTRSYFPSCISNSKNTTGARTPLRRF